MLRPLLIFFTLWLLGVLGRLFMRRGVGSRAGAGASNSWYQNNNRFSGRDTNSRNPYEVLGVSRKASTEEIRTAYRRLVQQYHPDRVVTLAPEFRDLAEERMKEINAAYQELKTHHGN